MVLRTTAGTGSGFRRADAATARERRIGIAYSMPAQCQVWLRVRESESPLGPQLTVFASLLLSSIQVRLTHRGTQERSNAPPDEIAFTMPLVPAGERVARPSQSVRGIRGGSTIGLKLFDHERAAVTEEHELGACADGIREAMLPLVARVHPAAWLSIRSGFERPEHHLRLDGELVFLTGLGLRVQLRPRIGAGTGPVTVDVPLASVGTTLHFPGRLVERGLPGLPSILLAFLDHNGASIGRERLAYSPAHAPR